MRDALEAWLRERRDDDATIVELRRLATGNSRAMWFVALDTGDRYVARVEQGGVFGTSGADEFEFMRVARALGCPVAPVRWLEPTGTVLGQPFFVMDFLDGAGAGRDDRSMSPELATDFVRRLDELHRTDWASQLSIATSPDDVTHGLIDRWHRVYLDATGGVVIPLLEEATAWLHLHAPPPHRTGIVHGDPGPGNMVHDGRRVIAFTDWEFAHVGDPMEDWSYVISVRGRRTMSPDDWVALFRSVAGVEVTELDLRYWAVFNGFKGACANTTCRRAFASANPAPNMGIIGTAIHQTFVRQIADLIGDT